MNGNIERRVSEEDIQYYLFSQPHFFTNMENYEVRDSCYFEWINQMLPKNWSIQRREAWYVVKSDQIKIKSYGFKIHISLVSEVTEYALKQIVPILIKNQVAFKFLVDPEIHDFFNSQACNRVSAGKFLTVYPPDIDLFKEILQRLHEVTKDFFGPFILSDRPYQNSRCLFYRFGSFIGNKQRNVLGECNPAIVNAESGDIDVRLPYYQLPGGVSDPFEEVIQYPENSLLNQRYQVINALSPHSSKGGVYLAKDTQTDTKVVLKEARLFINRNRQSEKDAIVGLMHEEHILKRLQDIRVTPRVVDSFYEWQHHFLVLEYIPFDTLNYTDWQSHNILIKGVIHDFSIFCRRHLTILKNIIDTVEKIHQMGIIIGDIAPQNILFHPETLEVRFIDLEGAYDQKEERFYARITSRGFTTYHKDKQKKPNQIEDWCAVSSLSIHLLHPICPLFAINPNAKQRYLESLVKSHGLPLEFITIEEALRQNRVSDAKQAIEILSNALKDGEEKKLHLGMQSYTNKMNLPQILGGITNYIERFVEYPMKGTVLPLDYRALTTNKLSVAYGYLGVLYFLHKRAATSTQQLLSMIWSEIQNEDLENFPPGLYIGLSGIAWSLHACGLETEALDLMKRVYGLKFRDEAADLFYGVSGWGLASLYFYEKTKSQQFLDGALEAAHVVDNKLTYQSGMTLYQNIDGQFYSGLLHGNAGIALFFLRLFQSSQNRIYLEKAECIMQSEINNGQVIDHDLVWRKNYNEKTIYPYFQFGSIGIGLVAIRFYLALGDPYYLELAKKIADSVVSKYCIYPGLFIGMAGIGIFFLDLYSATQHESYLQEAHQVAHRIMLYQYRNNDGIVFPGDKLAAICTDYGTGSTGIGLFLHRLSKQGKGSELFLDLE
ncbi:class III lanthionine synthetase LanKC [Candidatus Tisiphia endosymbiont of Sialis lutaria]|uniref:class III lanthionine synthetase LanKC n=1 Tax=Candidatus Tisiphia endosymbiont of Sialis lutaria TaxID=2029164 RepID=UPI00312C9765